MSNRNSSNPSNWLECAKWLNDCEVFNQFYSNRLQSNCLTANDLANVLRDGLLLCNLINRLIPGSIEVSLIQNNSHSLSASQQNAKLFLNACKTELGISEKYLFQPHMLYDLNIEFVIPALSYLSKVKKIEDILKRKGFSINEGEIYQAIEPIGETEQDSIYMPAGDILDDAAYQKLVNNKNDLNYSKLTMKDHATHEIFSTERNFVQQLRNLNDAYMKPMKNFLIPDDFSIIFSNFESLYKLHSELLEKLRGAIEGEHGRTSRICKVFESFALLIMNEYIIYFSGMKPAESKLQILEAKNPEFKKFLGECQRNSREQNNFHLRDILKLPFQRVLKYHILFHTLKMKLDAKHSARVETTKTYDIFQDLSHYLNEAQRDTENLIHIETLNNQILDQNGHQLQLKDFGHLNKDENIRVKVSNQLFTRTRYALLFDKALLICKSNGDKYHLMYILNFSEYKIEDYRNSDPNSSFANNSTQICLQKNDLNKVFLYFKTPKQKEEWSASIMLSFEKIQPRGYNSKGHNFALTNFGKDVVYCSVCTKIIPGAFYQGYKCTRCSIIAHKSCLLKQKECDGPHNSLSPMRTTFPQPVFQFSVEKTKRLSEFNPYNVRAMFANTGILKQPDADCNPLIFNVGNMIKVTDDDDETWWKGYKIDDSNKIEGYFPKAYVSKVTNERPKSVGASPQSVELESESYYCVCDRDRAVRILTSMPSNDSNIFLLRPSADGNYAFTIRNKPNLAAHHVRIHSKKSREADTTIFYLLDKTTFTTIQELVAFYMKTPVDVFKEIKGTIGIPYRDALPKPKSEAIAIYDFFPTNQHTGVEIELRKGDKYFILKKEPIGYWRIYDSNGLLGYVSKNYLQEINQL